MDQMVDLDGNSMGCWSDNSTGDVKLALTWEAMKAKGVTMLDPFLLTWT